MQEMKADVGRRARVEEELKKELGERKKEVEEAKKGEEEAKKEVEEATKREEALLARLALLEKSVPAGAWRPTSAITKK
jgi:hypothetical protein